MATYVNVTDDASGEFIKVEMRESSARMLVRELEDVAQSFPGHGLLQGDTPYAALYRVLRSFLAED